MPRGDLRDDRVLFCCSENWRNAIGKDNCRTGHRAVKEPSPINLVWSFHDTFRVVSIHWSPPRGVPLCW